MYLYWRYQLNNDYPYFNSFVLNVMFNFCMSQKCIYNLEDELAASSPLSRRNPCPHSPQDPVDVPDMLERECRGAEETPRGGGGVPAASSSSTQSPWLEGIYSAQKTAQVGIVCVCLV